MLLALAAVTLSQVWVCRVDSEFTDFAIAGDSMAFGTYASFGQISLETGKKKWAFPLKEGQLGVKVASDELVTVVSIGNGPISAFDTTSGKAKWSIPHKGFASPMLLSQGRLYAETEPNRLGVIDAGTHKPLWTAPIDGSIKESEAQVAVNPLSMGDAVVVGARSGSVTAFDAKTGEIRWQTALSDSPIQALAYDDERVYASSARGVIYALGSRTGTILWHFDVQNAIAGKPLLKDGRFAIVSQGGFVVWVAALNGAELWRRTFSREEDFSVTGPAVEGDGILFMRRSGAFALDQVGREQWAATFPSAASFRTPERYRGDYILFDSHAVFRARTQ